MAYGTVNADVIGTSVAGSNLGAGNATVFKNRIINGDMRIDQRNAGASVATSSGTSIYTIDRWQAIYGTPSLYTVQQNAASVTPPVGFTNYLGCTSTSNATTATIQVMQQAIEGLNVADLGWGTANAKAVTLSFWARSSLTGTFGGSLTNNALNRSYPFTYSLPTANIWTQVSVTIPGDTTGTWLTTNGIGLRLNISLGCHSTWSGTAGAWAAADYRTATGAVNVVNTSGATFYITGVQLEVGSSATGFEYRDYGRELMLCQRYLPSLSTTSGGSVASGYSYNTTQAVYTISFPTVARTQPTGIAVSGSYAALNGSAGSYTVSSLVFSNGGSSNNCEIVATISSASFAAANGSQLRMTSAGSILFTGCEL